LINEKHIELELLYAELDYITESKAIVMVVEDDFSKRLELEEFCTGNNSYCYSYSNAEAALEKIHIIKPDLIITDWKMPGKFDGLTLIKKIRKQYSKTIPILFLTAHAEVDTHHQALKAKATVFIDKMAHIEILDEQINSLLSQRDKRSTLDKINTPLLFKKQFVKSELSLLKLICKLTKKYLSKEKNIQLILSVLNNTYQIPESKIRRFLKLHLAVSPQRFITYYGLYLAKGMLLNNVRLQEVSYSLGYNNDSNFVNAFKKKYGLPPKEHIMSVTKIAEYI
jgi:DNA-binding response OmpR family regulator